LNWSMSDERGSSGHCGDRNSYDSTQGHHLGCSVP
jgi:hypothetical protein